MNRGHGCGEGKKGVAFRWDLEVKLVELRTEFLVCGKGSNCFLGETVKTTDVEKVRFEGEEQGLYPRHTVLQMCGISSWKCQVVIRQF